MASTKVFRQLKSYRILCGLKQKDLANLIGCGTGNYCAKESGKVPFSLCECLTIKKEINKHLDKMGKEQVTIDDIFLL